MEETRYLSSGLGKKNAPCRYGRRHHFLHQHSIQQGPQPLGRCHERHLGPPLGLETNDKNNAENETGEDERVLQQGGVEGTTKTMQSEQERKGLQLRLQMTISILSAASRMLCTRGKLGFCGIPCLPPARVPLLCPKVAAFPLAWVIQRRTSGWVI